ncbi:MAG: hypothetical protein R2863_05420 [Candidatus Kapaibacterium sp.]|nr:hypothetical protein [Ignavibacteriota bacterium]
MKIKNALYLILLVVTSTTLLSETPQENVRKDFETYLNHLINQEFTESVEYLYPELFAFAPKEQIISTMEQTFNSPEIQISLTSPNILNTGEIRLIDSAYYCKLTYSHQMYMKFNQDTTLSADDIALRDEMTLANLKSTFGEDNVSYDSVNNSFDILSEKDSYGKSINGKTEWKFVDVDANQIMLLNALLPQKIVDEITTE